MSLLMDALKKAEKAREHENTSSRNAPSARKDPEYGLEKDPPRFDPKEAMPTTDASLGGLSLEPLQNAWSTTYPDPLDDTRIRGSEPDIEPELDLNLSLDASAADLSFDEDLDERSLNRPKKGPGLSPDEQYFPEDTSATLPSLKAARRSVDDYFDGTRPLPVVKNVDDDTTITTQREALKRASRDQAKTVIRVKRTPSSGRARRYVVFGLLPLIILIGSGAGYYYWWNLTAVAPLVAKGQPPSTPAGTPPIPLAQPEPLLASEANDGASGSSRIDTAAEQPLASAEQPSLPESSLSPEDPLRNIPEASVPAGLAALASDPGEETRAIAAPPQAPAQPEPPSVDEDETPQTAMADSEPNQAQLLSTGRDLMATVLGEPTALPGASGVLPFIKIAKKRRKNTIHPQINTGYQAFRNGDYKVAGQAYARVLRRAPKNRDALLGIAAVAHAEGELVKAGDYYLKVLQLNPRDGVAQAALLSLKENLDPLRSINRIRLLLDQQPEADYLHFGLGNLYSSQQQWPAAQASYFRAYSLQPDNPDYAFNLAVSLDHMSHKASAQQYYERALELADNNRTGFQVSDLLARIQSMRATGQQP